jgi:Flp pilus assembly protein TadG
MIRILLTLIGGTWQRLRAARTEAGVITLEGAVIAAGLLALALGLVAVLVAAVHSHEASIQ